MLKYALKVLNRQKPFLLNESEEECFQNGLSNWKTYYSEKIYNKLLFQFYDVNESINENELEILNENAPELYFKFIDETSSSNNTETGTK